LEEHGLKTIADLQDTTLDLRPMVGSFAASLKQRAFGNDDRIVDPSEERKSISAENTFLEDTEDRPTLRAALRELAADVSETLIKLGLGALTVQVKVRYTDFTTVTRQISIAEPASRTDEIYRLACFLLGKDKLVKGPLRLIGVGVSSLVPPVQKQLWLPLERAIARGEGGATK
jgi:DNA polymerase-4